MLLLENINLLRVHCSMDEINNNGINAKYHQMAFRSVLGGITIWNLWSNGSDVNLEDSACTVRELKFFSIVNIKLVNCSPMATQYK